ncbi:MAG: hypothetical protein F4Y31_12445 [Gammaproteobacteria bacterium]|nr:hypothetical protein [Gammaproteobacteria bacterium]MYE49107.1 hypothetical protein [Gammaproteobacteria bacterium]MYF67692.1 hypothetical protein [Gammaproteobacteria bacterium]MYK36255.1 hypothetical protein [Gammaproteobacteria bacterium]
MNGNGNDTGGRRRFAGLAQTALVLAVFAVAVYFARAPEMGGPQTSVARSQLQDPEVGVAHPVRGQHSLNVSLTGEVRAQGKVGLRTQVAGRVLSVSDALRGGGTFRAGQTLLTIDPMDFEIDLKINRALLQQQEARLRWRELRAEEKREEFQSQNPGRPVPPLVNNETEIARYQARVDAARAAVEKSELNLARTRYSLPFDGRIVETTAMRGQLVGPLEPFGLAFSRESLEVEAPISLDDLDYLDPAEGRAVQVIANGEFFPAFVDRVAPIVNRRSRLVRLYVKFADSVPLANIPAPGTFVNLSIEGPAFENSLLLPKAAEQANGTVWVVRGGVLEAVTPRSLGRTEAGWIVSDFDTGDGVVLGAVPAAEPGVSVTVVDTSRNFRGE